MKMPGSNRRRCRGVLMLVMGVGLPLLLSGCGVQEWIDFFHLESLVTFFTAGPVAAYERNLMLFTFTVMLFVLVPVVALTVWFAFRYRASNTRATYKPDWSFSTLVEVFLWAGPIAIILVLGTLTWVTTHDMDPYTPIESKRPPIRIEAIAMDWKWLFIYPDYNVAVVNEMPMVVRVPVAIDLTSATVMNAFMIPRLGSQVYAMSGMQTKLHLMADRQGSFFGKNYQYSGDGFAHMTFQAEVTDQNSFDQWIKKARASGHSLNLAAYEQLLKPSKKVPVTYYSSVAPQLFEHVIAGFNSGYNTGHAAPASR